MNERPMLIEGPCEEKKQKITEQRKDSALWKMQQNGTLLFRFDSEVARLGPRCLQVRSRHMFASVCLY